MAALLRVVAACGLVLAGAGCGPSRGSGDDVVRDDARVIDASPLDALPELDAPPATPPIPPDCFAAAERGLAWLVTQQQADGAWGTRYKIAATGLAVLKLETYAAELGMSPFAPDFPYVTQVERGLDYLFSLAWSTPISVQLHGDPDSSGDGLGIAFNSHNIDYETAIGLMAIVAGREPDRVVTTAGAYALGLTYRKVAVELTDFFAEQQTDAMTSSATSCTRGGWSYSGGGLGDTSVSQFVTTALEYARHPRYHFEIPTQPWVLTELRDRVACIQNHDGLLYDGGAGSHQPRDDVNAYKTGALIQQLAFLGDAPTTPATAAALAYLQRVWTDPTGQSGWRLWTSSNHLAMYSIMKGLESMGVNDLGGIDWYRDFCDQLKTEQLPDGSWSPAEGETEVVGGSGILSTEWALLVLERAAPPPEVIP